MRPILISNLVNIRYLSGVEMTFGMMIITTKSKKLFVDSRYIEKAQSAAHDDVIVLPIDELTTHVQRFNKIRFEAEDITVARLQRWKKRFRETKLIHSSEVIEDLRRKKRDDELRAIRKACKITDEILGELPAILRWGGACSAPTHSAPTHSALTEHNIAWKIKQLAHELGADDLAFDTIVAFGSHTSRPHHSPTNRKLKKGDIVQIDMGVKVDGYCSDCSRVFFTGKPSDEQQAVFDLLSQTVKECTKKAKPDITNHALDKFARKLLGKHEQYFTHGLGHGVGLEIHEGASISSRAPKQRIKENEVITIEPGIYLPKKWGMRIEDTILVTKEGGKPLTKVCY